MSKVEITFTGKDANGHSVKKVGDPGYAFGNVCYTATT